MKAVERNPALDSLSDATSKARRPQRSPTIRTKSHNRIPPAVPSPPSNRANRSPRRKKPILASLAPGPDMASDYSSQWFFTEPEVANTPSTRDGLSISEERTRRAKGVSFITQVGILLKLPQLTLATASVFFHRFYMRHSMVPEKGGIHHYNIAATAIFLATKTEENCRKTKEIVISVAKVAQKNASLIIDEQSKEYWRWRDNILTYEELMLEILTFDLAVKSPYNYLYDYIRELQIEDNKPLRNAAWAFLNDSCITIMCLVLTPKDTAIASLYFAARYTGETIPEDEDGRPWWEHLGAVPTKIAKAISIMSEFYKENPLKRNENPLEQSPAAFGNEVDLERTRGNLRTQSPEEAAPSRHYSPNGNTQRDSANTSATNNGVDGAPHSKPPPAPSHPRNDPDATFDTSEDTIAGDSNIKAEPEPSAVPDPNAKTNGSSDAALKAAANDPATHEANNQVQPTPEPTIPTSSTAGIKPEPNRTTDSTHHEPAPTSASLPPVTTKQEEQDEEHHASDDSVDLVKCHSVSPPMKRKESPKRKARLEEGMNTPAKKVKREMEEESEEGEFKE